MHAGDPPPSSTTPVHVNQYKEVVQEEVGKKLLPEVVGMQHRAENNTSCSINNELAEEEEPPPLQTPLPSKVAELEEGEGKQQQHCESYTISSSNPTQHLLQENKRSRMQTKWHCSMQASCTRDLYRGDFFFLQGCL